MQDIDNRFAQTNAQLSSNKNDLQQQINALVLESDGDSNLEVVQARVGVNGDYHQTLKGRIDNVENTILHNKSRAGFEWEMGSLSATGETSVSNTRIRTKDYKNLGDKTVDVSVCNGYKALIFKYEYDTVSGQYVFIERFPYNSGSWLSDGGYLSFEAEKKYYYKFLVAEINDGTANIDYANQLVVDIPDATEFATKEYVHKSIHAFTNPNIELNWECGTLNSTTGKPGANETRIRTTDFVNFESKVVSVSVDDNYKALIYKYEYDSESDSYLYIERFPYQNNGAKWLEKDNVTYRNEIEFNSEDYYYKFLLANTSDTNISVDEKTHISVKKKTDIITRDEFEEFKTTVETGTNGYYSYIGDKISLSKHKYNYYTHMSGIYVPNHWVQGCACINEDLHVYYTAMTDSATNGLVNVYDLSTKVIKRTYRCESSTLAEHLHLNTVCAGIEKNGNDIPYVYISEWGYATPRRCFVESLTTDGSKVVQIISVQSDSKSVGEGSMDYIVDTDGGYLYIYTYKLAGVSTLLEKDGVKNKIIITKFNLPKINDGDVTLTDNDIINQFELPFIPIGQGKMIVNGKLYVPCGNTSYTEYVKLYVIDLNKKAVCSVLDLYESLGKKEPEGCFMYQDSFYLTDTDSVYRFDF